MDKHVTVQDQSYQWKVDRYMHIQMLSLNTKSDAAILPVLCA